MAVRHSVVRHGYYHQYDSFFLFIVTDGNKDETDKPTVTAALSVVDESVDESSTPVATSATGVSTAGSKTIRISAADQQKENKGESSSDTM